MILCGKHCPLQSEIRDSASADIPGCADVVGAVVPATAVGVAAATGVLTPPPCVTNTFLFDIFFFRPTDRFPNVWFNL